MSRPYCKYYAMDRCRFGDQCQFKHSKETTLSSSDPLPQLPTYLGTPQSYCGYCPLAKGLITSEGVRKFLGVGIDLSKIKYNITISMDDVELAHSVIMNDEQSRLSQVPMINGILKFSILKGMFSDHGDALWQIQPWPDRFIDSRKPKPSDKHFVIMVSGIQNDSLISVPQQKDYSGFHLVWVDAWPTQDEIKQMLLFYPDFVFGLPRVSHRHGN